ncbi:MAG TPA: 4Fe-4S binding protein, partial [Thermodesulfobacteriota bacterium]|nr:4Fe-4S binding protein [Thermodesulfobacteriota bacterium]
MPEETLGALKKRKNNPISPSDPAIDFHAPEFNTPDDLNDWTGNYRSFQPLGNTITADMRHQMERRDNRSEKSPFKDQNKNRAEKTPEDVDSPFETPEPLTVISEGRVLLVHTHLERSLELARELEGQGLTCTLVITSLSPAKTLLSELSERGNPDTFIADRVTISGTFSRFWATLTTAGRQTPLANGLAEKSPFFDLVLDLQSLHSYVGSYLPLGYYFTGDDTDEQARAMAELPEMRGRFLRPRFTSLLKERCFHGRLRKHDCSRCLAVCPFGAIQAIKGQVSIDPFLCQGCGACTLICPPEAIILHEPTRDESIRNLQEGIKTGLNHHSPPGTLVIRNSSLEKIFSHPLLPSAPTPARENLEFESDPLIGLDRILAALAFGAREVLIPWVSQGSPHIRRILEFQVEMARAVLRGLGWDMERVRLIHLKSDEVLSPERLLKSDRQTPPTAVPLSSVSVPFRPTPNADQRSLTRQSAQYLFDSSAAQDPVLSLPEGSPFGTV